MEKLLKAVVASSMLLLMASCATTKTVTLPALDASKVLEAEALIVEIEDASLTAYGLNNDEIVHGSGEGAVLGMKNVLEGTGGVIMTEPDHDFPIITTLAILALPITLSTGAVVGAVSAHSDEEIETATAILESTHQDHRNQLGFLDRKIISAIQDNDIGQWECINTASLKSLQCSKYNSHARLNVMPKFNFLIDEDKFDPDVTIVGDIVITAMLDSKRSNNPTFTLFNAQWSYREEIGSYFNLAKDDGALLRQKTQSILDEFVQTIVRDIFLTSEPQMITEKKHGNGDSAPVLPEGKVIRVR
jgi:hypothetical protein